MKMTNKARESKAVLSTATDQLALLEYRASAMRELEHHSSKLSLPGIGLSSCLPIWAVVDAKQYSSSPRSFACL